VARTFAEAKQPVKTFVQVRGDFLRKGDEVQPGFISALHQVGGIASSPLPSPPSDGGEGESRWRAQWEERENGASREAPRVLDRLDLAHWMVDPANPLTSRVAMNRIWQHLFGRGLVSTPEDFGTRGEPPSHPQLLDWLATEFIARGWSRKTMIKLIASSATYRQASRLRADVQDRDPLNILLTRQNRIHLESEIIRDVSLSAGGLLNPQIGGPSFRPPTTAEFKKLGGAGAFAWVDSEAPAKYRRGLYVFGQRTVPYPLWTTFDQANPSESCPRRERSTTPLQALALMNNPVFVESAGGLARRMHDYKAKDPRKKLEWAFEVCLARKPTRAELARLKKLYDDEMQIAPKGSGGSAESNGESRPKPMESREAASLLAVAQVIVNLDEFTTRE